MLTDDLAAIRSALSEAELFALRTASDQTNELSPGLFAYLEHACDWELSRRGGCEYPLLGPFDAIDDDERDKALMALLAVGVAVGDHPVVGRFIEAVRLAIEGERPTVHSW